MNSNSADRAGGGASPADVLRLIRGGQARTRGDLQRLTGMARSTVAQRIDALTEHGLVVTGQDSVSSGGRPSSTLQFNHQAGLVLAADCGATHTRTAIFDLGLNVLAEQVSDISIAEGPEAVLDWLSEQFTDLLRTSGLQARRVMAIGVGLPGPVEHATGTPVAPPIMPGWDGFDVPRYLQRTFPVPVLVDNDVNLMALGEAAVAYPNVSPLAFVKVGTGVGCGIVTNGTVFHGAHGAAGDIGHIRAADHHDVVCWCGNVGCLEAVAGGKALVADLHDTGVRTNSDVVDRVLAGDAAAVRAVRNAGREIGGVLAGLVSTLNPAVIVLGGQIAEAGQYLLAGVREAVYARSLPLGTRDLEITRSQLADRAGITGAAIMTTEKLLTADSIDALIAAR
ncbi:sugar kinase [Mycolicibacterium murale]|uniref:Sugar kinase n=1 Tax=Mycolicibacterium murale TaxID=182220 RepID=A0A7I9WHT7_9MYCO|nr:ROK family transcriptional regulator [Mycolicibacterium murale]MCV7180656.1 ROK family transcriptional regulator [Mycolicibacterium murale]GFG56878.1 sugar kinase [Mycolicibacterium murale]